LMVNTGSRLMYHSPCGAKKIPVTTFV
jgi:hypothetical protein